MATDNVISVNLTKPKGMGAFHPQVKIDSISLYPTSDIIKSKQDPHINHPDEVSVPIDHDSIDYDTLTQVFKPMKVVLDLFVLLPIENNSHLSFLFDGEITKYLKIGIVKCSKKEIHQSISADYYTYLNPSGIIPTKEYTDVAKYTKWDTFKFENKLPESINKALEAENGTADFVDLGIQTNLPYEKITATGKQYYKVPFKHEMTIPAKSGGTNPDFLSFFVYTYFDVDELKDDFSLGSTGYSLDIYIRNDLFKNLSLGTVASDIVITGGNLYDKTFGYKYSSEIPAGLSGAQIALLSSAMKSKAGQWYWGPVHQMPNGKWMTGASHSSTGLYGEASLLLDKVEIANAKIKDFRQKEELESFNFDFNQLSQYFTNDQAILKLANAGSAITKFLFSKQYPDFFSEFYTSRDIHGANRYLFSFNLDRIVTANSLFGDMIVRLKENNKQKYENLMKQVPITSLKIFRRKVKRAEVVQSDLTRTTFSKQDFLEMIVYSSADSSGILNQLEYDPVVFQGLGDIYRSELVATIAEAPLLQHSPSSAIRTVTGVDYSVANKLAGLYEYSIEMEMIDPSVFYLETLSMTLKQILEGTYTKTGFSEYMQDMSDPSFSDPFSDRFRLKAFKFYLKESKYPKTFISDAVKKYVDTLYELGSGLNNIFQIANNQQVKHFHFLCSIVSPNTGSIDGVILFYNLVKDLIEKLDKVIGGTKGYAKLKEISSAIDPHIENNPNIVANTKPRSFKVSHTFKNMFDAEIPAGYGLDFISSELEENSGGNAFIPNGLKVYTVTDLKKRFNLEDQKLFNIGEDGDLNVEINVSPQIGNTSIILNPGDTSKSKKFCFLSPSFINLPSQQPFSSLANAKMGTPEKHAEAFLDIYGSRSDQTGFLDLYSDDYIPPGRNATQLDLLNTETEKRFDLHRIFAKKGCTVEVKNPSPNSVSSFKPESDFFGINLEIDQLLEYNFQEYILDTNINTNKILSMLLYIDDFSLLPRTAAAADVPSTNPTINSMQFYNPTSFHGGKTFKNEFIAAEQNKMLHPLKLAPNHVKALLLSQTNPELLANNILKSMAEKDQDPFKNMDGFPYIYLNYKMISKIEVFREFKDGSLQNPIFTEMVENDLEAKGPNLLMLCRQKRYYNPTYGIVESDFISLPTFDEYFFLSKQTEPTVETIDRPDTDTNIIDFSAAEDPLARASAHRIRFFETDGPDLVLPEYIESGLLETPRLDDGLSDPVMRKTVADDALKRASARTTGQNIQRMRQLGMGSFIGALDLSEASNATMSKDGNGMTKSFTMNKVGQTKKQMANEQMQQDSAMASQGMKSGTSKKENTHSLPPTSGGGGGYGGGGSTY